MSNLPDPSQNPDQQALLEAVNALLLPLARLAVARGVHFADVEERLKTAFIQAAREAHPGGLPHRQVSRISTTTGINRREVTRLVNAELSPAAPRRSAAAEAYAHWLTNPEYRNVNGEPLALPRQGPRPSFESLAQGVTRDVHPRSMLSDMLRLGFASWDEHSDTVSAVADALVPRGDMPRALRILGDNVGAHFAGAVANVLADGRQHFDQAIVASGVPESALPTLRKLVAAQWRRVFDDLVPQLERLIEQNQAEPNASAEPVQRAVIGFYSHHQPAPASDSQPPAPGDSA